MTTAPLRVSVDVTAVPAKPAGAGRYTIELVHALAQRQEVDLVLLSRRDDEERWNELVGGGATVVAAAPSPRPLRLVWEQIQMHRLLDSLKVDVHHGPHYTIPERAKVPVVATVHDCTFFDHPEWHERSKVWLFRRAIQKASERAASIICVSATTASRLAEVCRVTVPVVVAPHGVDHSRFLPTESSPGTDDSVMSRLGLKAGSPTIVFVGTLEPRKGVVPLITAFDGMAARYPKATLVLGGQMGWGTDETETMLSSAVHRDRIVRLGYVPDDALPSLLRRATVVAYPALEEGFGLPVLEAMACGASIVTTEGTAMAEMATGVARLVRPNDVKSLSSALIQALDQDPEGSEREREREAGVLRAEGYTWDASATLHIGAYYRAAGRSVPPETA
jgi:glycosyltransferase involved in cell wall biosynthesis